MRYIFVVDCSG